MHNNKQHTKQAKTQETNARRTTLHQSEKGARQTKTTTRTQKERHRNTNNSKTNTTIYIYIYIYIYINGKINNIGKQQKQQQTKKYQINNQH